MNKLRLREAGNLPKVTQKVVVGTACAPLTMACSLGPTEPLTLGPTSPPNARLTVSPLAALCTVPPLMPLDIPCAFSSERNIIIFCRPQPASQSFKSMKGRPFLTPLLIPILSGLWGPRSLTMAFSRRFLACRTLGVPSEHGPLLSHLSVNKQSRGTHSQEGPHGVGVGEDRAAPGSKGRLSLALIHEGRTVRTPPAEAQVPPQQSQLSIVCGV